MSSVKQNLAETLETHLAGKTTNKKQNSNTLNPQHAHTFSMPRYTEKPGGLLHHQMLAPNLHGRSRPTGEQISGIQYPHSHTWDKPAKSPRQSDLHLGGKKKT
jgi:hypothetical protein